MSIASEISRINANIASAYAACAGRGAIMPQNENSASLAGTINSIGDTPTVGKDISFYDSNGTLLYGFSFAEASALTALPPLPAHTGLTAQGWNHSFSQVKYCARCRTRINVGATYTTSDGSTRLYLFVAKGTNIPSLQIHMRMAANQTATVNWGDGTTGTVTNSGTEAADVYAEKTNYAEAAADTLLCVKITGGSFMLGGSGSYSLFGTGYEPVLIKAELGANCTGLTPYAFQATSLKEIVISPGATNISEYAFNTCNELTAAVFPSGITSVSGYTFSGCYSLKMISLPESITDIGSYAFYACSGLTSIALSDDSLAGIKNNSFRNCKNLLSVRIPWAVLSIQGGAFNSCEKLYSVDLTGFDDPTSIPSLINTNAFNGTPAFLKFIVANQEMKTAFSAATNWSSFASQFTVG